MIRFVVLGALLVLLWFALVSAVRFLRRHEVDWPGVAFAVGFVMLAFWLQRLTGAGQLFG